VLCRVVAVGGRIVLGGGGLRWEGEAPAEPDNLTSQLPTTREGDNTTQHAQSSALFRVIPRPSFPAEPKHHTTRSNFRVIPRYSAAIVSHRVEIPHKQITSAARQEPRPPRLAGSAAASPSQVEPTSTSSVPPFKTTPIASANGSPSECLCNWCLAWSECFFTPRTSFYVEPESAGPE